ncbi:hypothetical protein [Colletotrichum gloeosporioides polymycovirus virus 1]|nr:hypothetical protein [Colletotrichum gloeosporioides polymycovirus virus 1]
MDVLTSGFYEPGDPASFIGSLLYHLILSTKSKKEVNRMDSMSVVREFLEFLTYAPSVSDTPLLDESVILQAQVAYNYLSQEKASAPAVALAVMEVVKSYMLNDIEDTEERGHYLAEDRQKTLGSIIEGRQPKVTLFPKSAELVFGQMRQRTGFTHYHSATNAFSELERNGIITKVRYLGVQREVGYWAVRVNYTHPKTKEKCVVVSPFMPTQSMARAFVAVCLHEFVREVAIESMVKRVKNIEDRSTVSFDRSYLRRMVDSANELLRTCRFDPERLVLVSQDGSKTYSIRSRSESVALAFSYYLTSGSPNAPPAVELAYERFGMLSSKDLSLVSPVPHTLQTPTKKISDYVCQHMRSLAMTRRVRAERGVRQLNHPTGYGLFSMEHRISSRDRSAYKLRERIADVVCLLNSRGVALSEVFFVVRWVEAFDLAKVLAFMTTCGISGILVVGTHHLLVRPMAIGSRRMANQVTATQLKGGLKEQVRTAVKTVRGLQFDKFIVISGGVAGAEMQGTGDKEVLVASREVVTDAAMSDMYEVVSEDYSEFGTELIYCSTDLLFPEACKHLCSRSSGPDTIDFSCSKCSYRHGMKDRIDSVFQYGLYLEKPRYGHAHNSLFSLVFDDIGGTNEEMVDTELTLEISKVSLTVANMFSAYRNLPGEELEKGTGYVYHLEKLRENTALKESVYRTMVDRRNLGPVGQDDLPPVALTELADASSELSGGMGG